MKVNLEYGIYKCSMLNKSAEEIYERAYEIDSYINLYEFLLELSQQLEEDELRSVLSVSDLLTFLYCTWLECDDSQAEELMKFLLEELKAIHVRCGKEAA